MRITMLAFIPLAACSMMAETINYAGNMHPLAGTCDAQTDATLTLRNGDIVFVPASGTIFLKGRLVRQTASAELTLSDPSKHPYRLTFQGTLADGNITGVYATPRCRYAVVLHRTQD